MQPQAPHGSDTECQGFSGSFEPVARLYDWGEPLLFRQSMQRGREALLSALPSVESVVIAGCGGGRFARSLLRAGKVTNRMTCVDLSPTLLAATRQRIGESGPITVDFVNAPIQRHAESRPHSCDLVVANFFLDLFDTELAQICGALRQLVKPRGMLYVTDFTGVGAGRLRFLYAFFRRMTAIEARGLPDYESALTDAGFSLRGRTLSPRRDIQTLLYEAAGAHTSGSISSMSTSAETN